MKSQTQQLNIPSQMLTCPTCHRIFSKPITLSCGHTFCKECLIAQIKPRNTSSLQQNKISTKQKISLCAQCEGIIWKALPDMRQNLVIQNLIAKFYPQSMQGRRTSVDLSKQIFTSFSQQSGEQYYNKILIRIKQPPIVPMPSCFSQIEFQTSFIQDIVNQSKCLVITWPSLFQNNLGLLGMLKKVEQIGSQTSLAKIVISSNQLNEKIQQKYKGLFQGIHYVSLTDIQVLNLNIKNRLIVIGGQNQSKITKQLQICNCSIFHSGRYKKTEVEQFQLFFRFYDNMNNPHYLRQIRTMIWDEPFQTRNNPQMMIYCVLRLLKLSNQQRKKLLYCFDDTERMQQINKWLLNNQNRTIDDILNLKIPGKYNSGIVFFIIFMLFAFNLFQDYNNK